MYYRYVCQFRRAIFGMGLRSFSDDEIDATFREFDVDNNGRIEYMELDRKLRKVRRRRRTIDVWRVGGGGQTASKDELI